MAAAQSCNPADLGHRSGSALADHVQASTHECTNTLYAFARAGRNRFSQHRSLSGTKPNKYRLVGRMAG
jgi:hypothetical protein